MANSSKREDSSSLEQIVKRQDLTTSGMSSASSSPSSSDETESITRPGNNYRVFSLSNRVYRVDTDHTTGPDLPRREENPFSFKHFLQNEPQTNYQLAGARPKVYSPPVTSPEPPGLDTETGVYPRNPTELPDFVQDHLVIEQCYLNHEAAAQPIVDLENLPDFALNSVEQRQPRHWNEPKKSKSEVLGDLPFDLTGTLDRGRRERSVPSAVPQGPLDLPAFDRPNDEPIERPESIGFPFDLQLPLAESDPNNSSTGARSCPPSSEANVTKSLPDFLSDGPIRTRAAPTPDLGPGSSVPESTDRRLILENERLRHDLEIIRRQNDERARRIQLLETELATRRVVDHEETAHLEKAMEQVEDNLKRSTRRAVNAESTVTALKQEIKVLTTEISVLRAENRELRAGMGAGYGVNTPGSLDGRIRRLTSDLKTAASTAEVSLRQLMTGVDNLRVIASALENVDRIEDRTKDFLPDFEEDNATGPAL